MTFLLDRLVDLQFLGGRTAQPEKVLGGGFTQRKERRCDPRGVVGVLGTVKGYRSNRNPKTAYSRRLMKSALAPTTAVRKWVVAKRPRDPNSACEARR